MRLYSILINIIKHKSEAQSYGSPGCEEMERSMPKTKDMSAERMHRFLSVFLVTGGTPLSLP